MKITYAKNTLGAALAAAPAQMAQTALVRAEDMLTKIGDDCVARVDELLAKFPRSVGHDPAENTRHIYEAYETGRKMIGIGTIAGLPEMDTVAASLCDVADGIDYPWPHGLGAVARPCCRDGSDAPVGSAACRQAAIDR